jgi:hypothetical protein
MAKNIFYRQELPVADQLMSYRDALLSEFLAYHTDFFDGDFSKGSPVESKYGVTDYITNTNDWRATNIKYSRDDKIHYISDDEAEFFPTAMRIVNYLGDDCPVCTYSVMEPQTIIKRHVGPDHYFQDGANNRQVEFLRIHMPLIIPDGDVYFEVAGEEVRWTDIFAFDNQRLHSAYNLTDQRRLVFIIDIRRSRIGMPAGEYYTKEQQEIDLKIPFERKQWN